MLFTKLVCVLPVVSDISVVTVLFNFILNTEQLHACIIIMYSELKSIMGERVGAPHSY